jgi:hypothetical protein
MHCCAVLVFALPVSMAVLGQHCVAFAECCRMLYGLSLRELCRLDGLMIVWL